MNNRLLLLLSIVFVSTLTGCGQSSMGASNGLSRGQISMHDPKAVEDTNKLVEENKTSILNWLESKEIQNLFLSMGGEAAQCALGSTSLMDIAFKVGSAISNVVISDVTKPGASLILIRKIQTYLNGAKGAVEGFESSKEKDCQKISGATYDFVIGHFEAMFLFWKFLGAHAFDIGSPVVTGVFQGGDPNVLFFAELESKKNDLAPELEGVLKTLRLSAEVLANKNDQKTWAQKIDEALLVIQKVENDQIKALESKGQGTPVA